MMRFYILVFLFLGSMFSVIGQETTYQVIPVSGSAIDSARVMQLTKVQEPCTFMSVSEKSVVQWMNIARMYPKWFMKFKKIRNIDPIYTETLINSMMKMKPIKTKLIPNQKMWESAQCHVSTVGPLGKTGHDRVNTRCKLDINAECIHYGGGSADYKVKRLVVDRGVPSLGHRTAILDPKLKKVGVSQGPFGNDPQVIMTVIDFGR